MDEWKNEFISADWKRLISHLAYVTERVSVEAKAYVRRPLLHPSQQIQKNKAQEFEINRVSKLKFPGTTK